MEFLNTLYESEYFIYIVGGAIGVLLILFLIVLLSGKKKEKASPEKVELFNEVTEKSVITDTNPVKEESLDATKEFKPEDLAVLQTKMAESESVSAPTIPEKEEVVTPKSEMVFESYKPEEPMTSVQPEEIKPIEQIRMIEEAEPFEEMQPAEPIRDIEPAPTMDPLITPTPRTSMSNQFSSVFINDGSLTNEPKPEVKTPEPVMPSIPVAPEPAMPELEEKISFRVTGENELPKLNTEDKEL